MAGFRFAIVVSRFNEDVTEGLLRGAREYFADASIPAAQKPTPTAEDAADSEMQEKLATLKRLAPSLFGQ